MQHFTAVRTVRSVKVVESFPHGQFLLDIHVVAIREQLVEVVLGVRKDVVAIGKDTHDVHAGCLY